MDFGITSVAAITVICLLIGQAVKSTALNNKWIPTIVGAAGAVLVVVGKLTMPDSPAADMLTAIAVGIVSGLGATGANQIYKQMKED